MTPPFPLSTIGQHFGDNAVALYQQGLGLKGHPGTDFEEPWGTPIPCAADGIVSAVLSPSDLAFYRAVNTIVEFNDKCYEVQYGHCSDIFVKPGDTVTVGQIVANVGNAGPVYVNGVLVSEADKLAGSHAGAHLHFQVREILKVPANDTTYAHYLNDGSGRLVLNGFAYAVPNWDNGYNGCVDAEPLFTPVDAPQINKTPPPSPVQAPQVDLSPADRLYVLAAQYVAQGRTIQATILFAVAKVVEAFSTPAS